MTVVHACGILRYIAHATEMIAVLWISTHVPVVTSCYIYSADDMTPHDLGTYTMMLPVIVAWGSYVRHVCEVTECAAAKPLPWLLGQYLIVFITAFHRCAWATDMQWLLMVVRFSCA